HPRRHLAPGRRGAAHDRRARAARRRPRPRRARRAARRQVRDRGAAGAPPARPVSGPVADEIVDDLPLEVEEFLTWLVAERGRSANTRAAYRRDLRAYTRWLRQRGRPVRQAGEADLAAYLGVLRSEGRAPSSVARAMAAVRTFHRFCVDEDLAE